jgi:hypothetical protein
MNRQDDMRNEDRMDRPFMAKFTPHLLWPILAVVVMAAIGLFVLSPWADDDNDEGPIAQPTPISAGTPNP